jgi:aspartate aminotransferase-like enzyme
VTALAAEVLLDQPPLQPAEVVELEGLVARTLRTSGSVVLCQAEAVTLLEAVASSVAGPGNRVLNVVTGPYGVLFGGWLRRTGAEVFDLVVDHQGLSERAFRRALAGVDTVALTQAEAATGADLELAGLLGVANELGVLTVVDAVAAIGAEPITVDDWGIDVAVIGGQKALAGPAGVSAASIGERAWRRIENNPAAQRSSTLSVLDWAEGWLRTDRSRIPGTPSVLETRALLAALRRVHAEGISAVELRHRRARAAWLAAVAALGLRPWAAEGRRAAICTTVALPESGSGGLAGVLQPGVLQTGALLAPGDGPLAGELFRVNHYGRAAELDVVGEGIDRLAEALGVPGEREAARQSAIDAWEEAG